MADAADKPTGETEAMMRKLTPTLAALDSRPKTRQECSGDRRGHGAPGHHGDEMGAVLGRAMDVGI